MKRSKRFYQRARRTALWAVTMLVATAAGAAWSVRAWQECAGLGLPCAVITLGGLCLCGATLREALRLARLGSREARWEWEREVRPRL